jgi:CRISPR-associated endonuclease Cas1
MAASQKLVQVPSSRNSSISKSGVIVLHGFGIKCRLDGGHFCAEWGVGFERYKTRLSRVEGRKLRRIILLSSDGYISLEALRFITDVGASFVMLDRRGKPNLVCSPSAPSNAKLRRAQALSARDGTALRISQWLIQQKLQAQSSLVRNMLYSESTAEMIEKFRADLSTADSIESVRLIESQGAKHYWGAWARIPIRWPRKDERRVPEHWKRFDSRISSLTHSPRLASNPPNALLNLLYCLLESECRIAAIAMGMDPDIGILHVDSSNRSSLACDLQEGVRASVDAFLLHWLQTEPLRKADFWEDRNGNCRIARPLLLKLFDTSETWRKLVAPVAEHVAEMLWSSIHKSSTLVPPLIATRLTHRKKREAKGSEVPIVDQPKPEHICNGCGKTIRVGRAHCSHCAIRRATEDLIAAAKRGRTLAHTREARAKQAVSQRRNALAQHSWQASSQPAWLTHRVYAEKIQPRLARISNSVIARHIGVSRWYAGRIRKGSVRIHDTGRRLRSLWELRQKVE